MIVGEENKANLKEVRHTYTTTTMQINIVNSPL